MKLYKYFNIGLLFIEDYLNIFMAIIVAILWYEKGFLFTMMIGAATLVFSMAVFFIKQSNK